MSTNKNKQHAIIWWMSPKCDKGQWWWGYQKVRKVVLSDTEKQDYLNKHNLSNL